MMESLEEFIQDDEELEFVIEKERDFEDTILDNFMETSTNLICYNKNILKELKGYFCLEIDEELTERCKSVPYLEKIIVLAAPTARNLIPEIIRLRRKYKRNFMMRLTNVSIGSINKSLINYRFISVDEYNQYDNLIIMERVGGHMKTVVSKDLINEKQKIK